MNQNRYNRDYFINSDDDRASRNPHDISFSPEDMQDPKKVFYFLIIISLVNNCDEYLGFARYLSKFDDVYQSQHLHPSQLKLMSLITYSG